MVLKIVWWLMRKICQIILALSSIKIRWDIQIIAIAPVGENYEPCHTYSVRESQSKRDAHWKIITAERLIYSRKEVRMALHISGLYVNLSSWINTTININGHTPLWMVFQSSASCARTRRHIFSRTSIYVDLPDVNLRLTTLGLVYRTDREKFINYYIDINFYGVWDQSDADNAEIVISRTGYVITYGGCPVLWCSKLQTEVDWSATELGYIALSRLMGKVTHFMSFMKELSYIYKHIPNPEVFCTKLRKWWHLIEICVFSW